MPRPQPIGREVHDLTVALKWQPNLSGYIGVGSFISQVFVGGKYLDGVNMLHPQNEVVAGLDGAAGTVAGGKPVGEEEEGQGI